MATRKPTPVKAKKAAPKEVKAQAPEAVEVKESKVIKLIAIKNNLTNGVTMDMYYTSRPTAPSNGIQHWEQMQINAGLLREV